MAYNPTPEQQKILDTIGKNIIVSASAGSGKTTVMVEKIFRLISEEKVPVKNLLVVTFTKSASAEMKQRLEEKLKQNSDDEFILSQLDDLPQADICTVDSFCEGIVKKYFYAISIDSSFDVLDGQQKSNLQNSAMQKTLS